MDNLKQNLEVVKKYVSQAGQAIFQMASEGFETAYKANEDPVMTADLKADRILRKGLLGHLSDAGWLSEETRDDGGRLGKKFVWVVDPIDGTKEFVSEIPEYAVSVALVEYGLPVLAVVYNPATEEMFAAAKGARESSRKCDFELKNGSGFGFQGFIAGERFEHTTLLLREGMSDVCFETM